MARKGKGKGAPSAKPRETPVIAPVAVAGRDPRPWIYGALDLLFAVAQLILIIKVVPNRLPSATVHLMTLPLGMFVLGVAMFMRKPIGRTIALYAGSIVLVSAVLLIVRVIVSAAFLSGTYGAFGKAAAMTALTAVALLVELVALLPIVQVKYLMSRSGKRAFHVS